MMRILLARKQIALRAVALGLTATFFYASALPATSGTLEHVKKRGIFEACLAPNSMPLSSVFDGEQGLHVDITKALARELGVAAKFNWIEFRYQAKYTECDALIGVGIIPGLKGESRLTKTKPFMRFDTLMVTVTGKEISKLSDLDGLTVATQTGSLSHVTLIKKTKAISRVGETDEDVLLSSIADGSTDVGIVTNIGYNWYLHRNASTKFDVQPASILQDITGYPLAIGLRKADNALKNEVNGALERLKESGEMCKIFAKYGLQNTLDYSC